MNNQKIANRNTPTICVAEDELWLHFYNTIYAICTYNCSTLIFSMTQWLVSNTLLARFTSKYDLIEK